MEFNCEGQNYKLYGVNTPRFKEGTNIHEDFSNQYKGTTQ